MNDSTKAVFLSYASQDAEAAKRVCEALRAAGVEVWFDQSELRGGDSWDAKIRKQIKECALFVPVISTNTQARPEGYFRLEWRLADQRTHLMGRNKAFLMPVCVDRTPDADADVPDSFSAVQWTRLPGGETPAAFCERVKGLLTGGPSSREAATLAPITASLELSPPQKTNRRWLAPVLLVVFLGATLALWQPWRKSEKPAAVPPPVALSPGATELARVRAQLTPDRWQREDFAAMSPTLDRLLEANPELSDAWAMRSIINSLQVLRNYDSSTKPLEVGKAAADRAARLAPGSPLADIATGMHLVAMTSRGGDARACRPYLDRGVAALPPDALTRYAELASYWFAYDFDQVQRCGEVWRAAEPQASFPPWIFAQLNVVRRRPAEADKWAEMAMADPNITGVRAYFTAFESRYYLCADVPGAWAVLQRVPSAGRSVHRVVHGRWLVAMADRRWDEALQELSQVPETFLFDRAYHGPKALLAGLAHQHAGRADAAAAQFREAERLLKEHLATDSDNEELHAVLAVALACAGRDADARNELALVEPLVKGRLPSIYRGSLVMTIAQAYAVLGDYRQLAPWLRKLFAEPSQFPFTPASLRLDPRFAATVGAPEIQTLLKEFAALDQPREVKTEDRGQKPEISVPIDQKSVAVLAFANLSDDKANEYFSDGLSEELLNVLAKVPGLKVTARTSSFHFKGKDTPIPEIAQQLGVAYVIEGSVRKSGDKVRITAQLIKAADGFHVWSDTFTRDLKDIFAVQDEIAGLIANQLSLKLRTATPSTRVNPEAFRLYLEGRQEWSKRLDESLTKAEELFKQAIALDPEFARAHAGLADVWAIRAVEKRRLGQDASQDYALANASLDRALRLDPDLAEAHATRGNIYSKEGKTAEAEMAFQRTLVLNPSYASAHQWYGRLLFDSGGFDAGLAELEIAMRLDPLSPIIASNYGMYLGFARRWTESLAAADRSLAIRPNGDQAFWVRTQALLGLDRPDEALDGLRARNGVPSGDQPEVVADPIWRAESLARAGDREAAVKLAGPVLASAAESSSSQKVFNLYLALGRPEDAFAYAPRVHLRFSPTAHVYLDPVYDPVRDNPRFLRLIEEAGILDKYREAWAQYLAWKKKTGQP